MCKCANVLLTADHLESTSLTTVKTFDEGTCGVPKRIGGVFVHLFCVYRLVYVRLVL